MNKQTLLEYQCCQGKKHGILVSNDQYFYLYDTSFCQVKQLHLFVDSPTLLMDCDQPSCHCFFWSDGKTVHLNTQAGPLSPTTHAWALAHIQSPDGGVLRVIFYAEDGKPFHLLFADEAVEQLFLQLVRRKTVSPKPTQAMTDLANEHCNNAMELLTMLYLQSEPLERLSKGAE